jgi:fluoride exporter
MSQLENARNHTAVMKILLNICLVGVAGCLGALARYGVGEISNRWLGMRFPWGTFIINVTGSLFLGWFMTVYQRGQLSESTRLAVAVGFTGAYTTFSTCMFESNELITEGAVWKAGANLVASVVVGLLAVQLGVYMAQKW